VEMGIVFRFCRPSAKAEKPIRQTASGELEKINNFRILSIRKTKKMQILTYNFDKKIEQSILTLRKQKHLAGFPFMIDDSEELPSNQAYMEYADGTIEIVEFSADYRDYFSVRRLTKSEVSKIQEKHHLTNA
jgi:hypothetical protein